MSDDKQAPDLPAMRTREELAAIATQAARLVGVDIPPDATGAELKAAAREIENRRPRSSGLPQALVVAPTSLSSSERSGSSSSSKCTDSVEKVSAPSKPRHAPSKPGHSEPATRAPSKPRPGARKSGQAQGDITALLEEFDEGREKPVPVRLPNVPDDISDPGAKVVAFIELAIGLWLQAGEPGPYPLGCQWVAEGAARFGDHAPVSKVTASIWLRRLREWGALVYEDSDAPPNEKMREGVRLYRLGAAIAPEELAVPLKALGVEPAVVQADTEARQDAPVPHAEVDVFGVAGFPPTLGNAANGRIEHG